MSWSAGGHGVAAGERATAGRRCVVVGGAGAVGSMFAALLLDAGAEVCVVDDAGRHADTDPRARFEPGDITAIGRRIAEELRHAGFVVLAVPERVALAALPAVAANLRPGTLLVDTLSVKRPVVAALRAHAPRLESVSLNPMFAPSLGMAGRAVAAVVVHGGARAREFLRLIDDGGARIVELTADEHDRLVGSGQALTHAVVLAFGLGLAALDVDVSELGDVAPPPCLTLLALLARIASGAHATYWDVQAGNHHAALARGALAASVRRLADVIDAGCEEEFTALVAGLHARFGPESDRYREMCSRMFEPLGRVEQRTAGL